MDGSTFDALTRVTTQSPTRRRALGLLAGLALAGVSRFDLTAAKKARRKKRRKKKGGAVIVPPAAGCSSDAQCGGGRICQGGSCVAAPPPPPPPPPPPECIEDDDCGFNEVCQEGGCICPQVLQDRCVARCSGSSDCALGCGCRGLFPGDGQPRVVCVDETGLFCDRPSCVDSQDCNGNAICVFTTCGSPEGSGRCLPICARDED